uniref:ADP-ribosylglycohydrolase n=1 Tax=Heterorhabditis bacteriophora TaxID=37862 RepID=A0A1I7WZI0_HETBA
MSVSVGFVVGDLLTSQLKLLCPEEKDFCAAKVSRVRENER